MSNFKEMSLKELTDYVLKNRHDQEAWREYADRPRPNAITIPADISPEEEKRIFEKLLGRKNNDKQK